MGRVAAALVSLLVIAAPAQARELTLSVAVSMKEAVETLGARFASAHPGATLRYNLGASGDLEKQIEAGAPVDVFVAAGAAPMDALEARGLLVAGSRRTVARNVLVVVVPADAPPLVRRPADLTGPAVRRVAIGDPRTVPAGRYAAASLRTLGLWDALAPRLVFAGSVRQALEYVARGEVDAGFVYATDAALRPGGVREAFRPPPDSYPPIVYPAAVVRATGAVDLARAFVDLLAGVDGQAALTRLGFLPAAGGPR